MTVTENAILQVAENVFMYHQRFNQSVKCGAQMHPLTYVWTPIRHRVSALWLPTQM